MSHKDTSDRNFPKSEAEPMGQGNSGTPVTQCPVCKIECNEIFFESMELSEEWKLDKADDGHTVAWRSNPDGSMTCNPYPSGGTFLICKQCGLYTLYPRGEINV